MMSNFASLLIVAKETQRSLSARSTLAMTGIPAHHWAKISTSSADLGNPPWGYGYDDGIFSAYYSKPDLD